MVKVNPRIGFPMVTLLLFCCGPMGTMASPVRPFHPALPPLDGEIEFEDLDGDGDPDVLRCQSAGNAVLWIDDDDDMTTADLAGDRDSDCLMIDRNGDGQYGGPGDFWIDWSDEDGDGRADIALVVEHAAANETGWAAPANLMYVIDTDGDGVLHSVDWNRIKLSAWDHAGDCRFFEDYLGHSLFLKMHASSFDIRNPELNWENPFLFYDHDDDGLAEMAVRLIDTPQIHAPLTEGFQYPPDGDEVTSAMRRVEFTGKIDWVSMAYDLDNDSAPANEFDLDMTLHFNGPGFDYRDQAHRFESLRGLPDADQYFYDPRWRRQQTLIYPDHDAALPLVWERGEWNQCWLVFDEDDDCQRWERVELYYPRDPFKAGVHNGGIDWHPQADAAGDRGEWDQDISGDGQLYVGAFDGRLHLFGAEWGAWRTDQWAKAYQGWSRTDPPAEFGTVKYTDTDGNGFFDQLEMDWNGDHQYERSVSLLELGLDDKAETIDPSGMDYEDFHRLYGKMAQAMWQRAEAAIETAKANGIDVDHYAILLTPASDRQRYHDGYWLNWYLYQDLLARAQHAGDVEFMDQLDRAYFSGDWSRVTRTVARPGDFEAIRVEITNPLGQAREDATVELDWNALSERLPRLEADKVRVLNGGQELVTQVVDLDGDDRPEQLLFQLDLQSDQTATVTVQAAALVHRAMRSPVHAKYATPREDLAWESDRAAYRVYGPWLRRELVSNGIDVWVKRVNYPVIEKWYGPGVNYHEDTGEGADLFSVGPTLGCGGLGFRVKDQLVRGENFTAHRILAQGPVRTVFELDYGPQQVGEQTLKWTQRFSLDAGHHLTRVEVIFQDASAGKLPQLVAGLVKRAGVEARSNAEDGWLALWGPLGEENKDQLGMGVVAQPQRLARVLNEPEHLLGVFAEDPTRRLVYWTGAGWTGNGDFENAEAWQNHLARWAERVSSPLKITFPE